MTEPTLTDRVTILERKVEDLVDLPARVAGVELQIVELRHEMQVGFSAIRHEMTVMRDDLRTEVHGELHGIRGELNDLRGEFNGLRGEFNGLRDDLNGLRDELHETRDVLRGEIRAGDEETRRYMRVLHEDLIARIAALGDARR